MIKTTMVGIGKLGRALMEQWDHLDEEIGIYHPSDAKANIFTANYQKAVPVSRQNLSAMKSIILALPAAKIPEFLKQNHYPNVCYVNMATAVKTSDLQRDFPELQLVSMKFVGHSQDLYANGNGYFITEETTPDDIVKLYSSIGVVKKDDPEITNQINKLATFYGIKAAVELESEFQGKQFDQALIDRALSSITPEVIKAYQKGDLGHFAQNVAKDVKESLKSK